MLQTAIERSQFICLRPKLLRLRLQLLGLCLQLFCLRFKLFLLQLCMIKQLLNPGDISQSVDQHAHILAGPLD
ncbi:hypothetical protein D3C80_1916100 [compost metagenome]